LKLYRPNSAVGFHRDLLTQIVAVAIDTEDWGRPPAIVEAILEGLRITEALDPPEDVCLRHLAQILALVLTHRGDTFNVSWRDGWSPEARSNFRLNIWDVLQRTFAPHNWADTEKPRTTKAGIFQTWEDWDTQPNIPCRRVILTKTGVKKPVVRYYLLPDLRSAYDESGFGPAYFRRWLTLYNKDQLI
jgi:hypothetical protein